MPVPKAVQTEPRAKTGPAKTYSFSLYPRHIGYVKRRAKKRFLEEADRESDGRTTGRTSAVLREILEAEMERQPL